MLVRAGVWGVRHWSRYCTISAVLAGVTAAPLGFLLAKHGVSNPFGIAGGAALAVVVFVAHTAIWRYRLWLRATILAVVRESPVRIADLVRHLESHAAGTRTRAEVAYLCRRRRLVCSGEYVRCGEVVESC
jgi:hypothetical protein